MDLCARVVAREWSLRSSSTRSGHDGWWLSLTERGCPLGAPERRGLRREQLTAPDALIPFNAHAMLFENAARALREPCFGFRLGSAVELTEAGLLAYVILNSHDLGGALRNLCRYLPILTEGCVCELRREADEVRLLFSFVDPVGTGSRQLHDFGATLMVRICEAITGHRVRPVRIELRHAAVCPMLARQLASAGNR